MYDPAILIRREEAERAVLNTFARHFRNAASVVSSLQNLAIKSWHYSRPAAQSLSRFFAAAAIHNPKMEQEAYAELIAETDECGADLPTLDALEQKLQPFAKKLAHSTPIAVEFHHPVAA